MGNPVKVPRVRVRGGGGLLRKGWFRYRAVQPLPSAHQSREERCCGCAPAAEVEDAGDLRAPVHYRWDRWARGTLPPRTASRCCLCPAKGPNSGPLGQAPRAVMAGPRALHLGGGGGGEWHVCCMAHDRSVLPTWHPILRRCTGRLHIQSAGVLPITDVGLVTQAKGYRIIFFLVFSPLT